MSQSLSLTSWLTVLIATVVATVAILQWRVARQKFVLDLFDRRFKAYNEVLDAIRPIIGAGNASNENIRALHLAAHSSKFLFGRDVNEYLQELIRASAQLHYWNSIYRTNHPDSENSPQGMHDCFVQIANALTRYPELCQHYMMMPERRVRSPAEWFRDRNELRKSYGDEPAKLGD